MPAGLGRCCRDDETKRGEIRDYFWIISKY
jgi:hypothetical protein